jgi:RNA polymerase sigma factor (sigma-70 family)
LTEDEIIKLICAGGKATDAGVRALYQNAAQPMLRFFAFKGLTGDDAKDVLQETFVKIVRSADSFTGDGAAKAWIWQIARNCMIDHQRKKGSLVDHEIAFSDEQWRSLEETTADPKISYRAADSVDACVSSGLDNFSRIEPDRAMVLMLQMDGLSIEEIGLRIGRTAAATKEYLSQCKKKIQPFIAHCLDLLAT